MRINIGQLSFRSTHHHVIIEMRLADEKYGQSIYVDKRSELPWVCAQLAERTPAERVVLDLANWTLFRPDGAILYNPNGARYFTFPGRELALAMETASEADLTPLISSWKRKYRDVVRVEILGGDAALLAKAARVYGKDFVRMVRAEVRAAGLGSNGHPHTLRVIPERPMDEHDIPCSFYFEAYDHEGEFMFNGGWVNHSPAWSSHH